jgi:hypothetical protein
VDVDRVTRAAWPSTNDTLSEEYEESATSTRARAAQAS